jgi:hypothetical protein
VALGEGELLGQLVWREPAQLCQIVRGPLVAAEHLAYGAIARVLPGVQKPTRKIPLTPCRVDRPPTQQHPAVTDDQCASARLGVSPVLPRTPAALHDHSSERLLGHRQALPQFGQNERIPRAQYVSLSIRGVARAAIAETGFPAVL